jgi:hypothetical protein
MARVLIIAVAVLLGAASVWFLIPAPVATVADTPASLPTSKDLPTVNEVASTPVLSGGPMSAEKRRTRAEQLIGEPFKYISKDEVYSKGWFTEHGVQVIERAMDECFLLGNSDLFFQHVAATSDGALVDMDPEEAKEHLKEIQPSFSQLRNCINANRAYNDLFEAQG